MEGDKPSEYFIFDSKIVDEKTLMQCMYMVEHNIPFTLDDNGLAVTTTFCTSEQKNRILSIELQKELDAKINFHTTIKQQP